ncbi:MAG: DUF2207 domain-containing protein, partial [Acidimicrobiia bacterium]
MSVSHTPRRAHPGVIWSGRVASIAFAAFLCVVALSATTTPAAAKLPTGYVGLTSFRGDYAIQSDGTVEATETLTARFSGNDGHGIYRELINEQNYPPKPNTKRVYPITDIRVSADPGLSTEVSTSQRGDTLVIRIGSANRTVGPGDHTYVLRYRLHNALNHFDDHDEWYWNVTGSRWNAIGRTDISIQAPAPITRAQCFAGPYGTTSSCASSTVTPEGIATFRNGRLVNGGVTTAVALAPGTILPTPSPLLEDTRFNLGRWLGITPLTIVVATGELIILVAGIAAYVMIRGRDRQVAGSAIDQAFATGTVDATNDGERVPIFGKQEIPVEFVPPANLRPGLLGVLVDEEASTLDVTATIVDLATRGYIRIVEIEPTGLIFKHADWRLDRMRPDVDGLMSYEVTLLNALFSSGRNSVELSSLQNTFAAD